MVNKTALNKLLLANAISSFAQGISMLTIPWYFTTIMHQESEFGIIYSVTTLLSIFVGLYGGTLIDKYPRKNIFLTLCVLGFTILASVASVGYLNGAIPTVLVAFVFSYTLLNYQIHYPALYAFGQELTEKEHYSKTNSLFEIQGQATSILSGTLAAVLLSGINLNLGDYLPINFSIRVDPWALHEIFTADAITYLLSFIVIKSIRYTPQHTKPKSTEESVWNRMKVGFQFLIQKPYLLLFGVASHNLFVVVLVNVHQLIPIYIANYLEESAGAYASTRVLYAAGALLAGFTIRWITKNSSTITSIVVLLFGSTLAFIACYFTKSVWVLALFSLVVGVGNAGTRILRITYLFNEIPNYVIGRATSVFQMINIILRFSFITLFALPYFTTQHGIPQAYLISGIFVGISATVLLVLKLKKPSNSQAS